MSKRIIGQLFILMLTSFLISCSFVIKTRLVVSPTSHNFGKVKIGDSVNFDFILTNKLIETVTLDVIRFASDDTGSVGFSEISGAQGLQILSEDKYTVRVQFAPMVPPGKKSDRLYIEWSTSDGRNSVSKVKLTGTAKTSAKIEVSPNPYDFGYPKLNTTKSQDFTVKNVGSKDLSISDIEITGDDPTFYSITSDTSPFSLSPNDSKDITVEFTPTETGNKRAELRFTHNADNETTPMVINIQGDGVIPQISVPQTLQFSKTYIGGIRIQNLRINSIGSGPLTIQEINFSGNFAAEFKLMKPLPFNIASGAFENVPIMFIPGTEGLHDGNIITIVNNTEVDAIVNLAGTGEILQPIYQENFDGGVVPPGWIFNGGVWDFGKPQAFTNPFGGFTCDADHTTGSGNCIATNFDGPYSDNMAVNQHYAESPAFDISQTVDPVMTFYHWFEIEEITDKGYLKVSSDNGMTWADLHNANNYIYYGEGHSWNKIEIDLGFYKSSTVKLRWFLSSDDDVYYAGWYIDDIVVEDTSIWMPQQASNPSPADNASGIPVTGFNLTWSDNGTKHDVYLDTVNPPLEKISSNNPLKRQHSGGLLSGVTYYWRIVTKNDNISVLGDVWSFTTN